MYRLCQLASVLALLLFLPLLPLVALRGKYRHRLAGRLGFGLARLMAALPTVPPGAPVIWLHALSVGEATSALPLVAGIRQSWKEARIVLSVTTSSGHRVAEQLIAPHVDALIPGPIDLAPVIWWFLRAIRPDCFVLVETDLWPNWLFGLARHGVPTMLVNGRISGASFDRYHRHRWFFAPMFRTFSLLAMQTGADADKMIRLGVEPSRVNTLGNLKFDTGQYTPGLADADAKATQKTTYGFAAAAPLWICGSTHRGEEEALFPLYLRLRETIPDLQLLVAPRNIERSGEILVTADAAGLVCRRRTEGKASSGPVLLLDTIGELAGCYAMAEVVFIGGSLVPLGGHNPLEPAAVSVPVLYGSHMEDFSEIAALLVHSGGARQVGGPEALFQALLEILTNPALRASMAEAAGECVRGNRGVVLAHLEAIAVLLKPRLTRG